jgi:hypothetical protein
LRVSCRLRPSSCWLSRHEERLELRDHDGFERCVRYKATSFLALHLFLRGCERQLVNPVIALAIARQPWGSLLDLIIDNTFQNGRTSAVVIRNRVKPAASLRRFAMPPKAEVSSEH